MKVKILIAPLMIVSVIIIIVWLVQPAFISFNAKRAELKQEQERVSNIKEKVSNLSAISAKLSGEAYKSRRESLYQYIPDSIKEEDIINNLNYQASLEGLAVTDISVSAPEKKEALVSDIVTTEGVPIDTMAVIPQIASPDLFNVNYAVSGPYDKIKRVFDQIFKLERYNSLVSFSLQAVEKEDGSIGDNLIAIATMKFAYFTKESTAADPLNPVFNASAINDQTIDDIIKSKNVDVLKPVADVSERSNPFLP